MKEEKKEIVNSSSKDEDIEVLDNNSNDNDNSEEETTESLEIENNVDDKFKSDDDEVE